MENFYLGAHHPNWLTWKARVGVKLFVSRSSLHRLKKLPRAVFPWGQDSSGFTTIKKHGYWPFSAKQYAQETKRNRDEIGMLDHAAVQDWMCEPLIRKKTGLSVEEHQKRTIDSYIELMSIDSSLPWMPVIQGWQITDYWRHVEMYDARKIDLRKLPIVGVGSVCRRSRTVEAATILLTLADFGIRLHGFGVKSEALAQAQDKVVSADSMAWSVAGRHRPDMTHEHMIRSRDPANFRKRGCADDCASCFDYAIDWYNELMGRLASRKAA